MSAKRGRENGRFRDGYFAGWNDYRHGEGQRPVTLATAGRPPELGKDKRAHVVNVVIDSLRAWQLSPFEHEGTCRAALRASLCSEGWSWHRADWQAETLVAEGLRSIDARRPGWDEGQRQYADPRENCRWCSLPIAEEDLSGGRNRIFCSDECGRAAHLQMSSGDAKRTDDVAKAIYYAARRARSQARPCALCGTMFKSTMMVRASGEQKFCSTRCSSQSRRRDVPDSECVHCRTLFRPSVSHLDAKFCGMRCRRAHGVTTEYHGSCEWCGEAFTATQATARCCGKACANAIAKIRSGQWTPRRISPPVFDYVFKAAA